MQIFFIGGSQRSGTTLLSVMLSKHPEIDIDGDSIAFRMVSCFGYYKDVLPYNLDHSRAAIQSWLIEQDYKGRLAELIDPKNLEAFPDARAALEHGIARRIQQRGKTVFGDKSPNIEHFMADLLTLLPEAKFIHLVRDGRAVCASRSRRAGKNLYLAAQEWVDGNIIGLSNQAMIGKDRYQMIRYEDLLQKPEATMREICQFLDLPYDPSTIKEDQTANEGSYVKSSLDLSKIDNYRQQLSNREIAKIEKIQGQLLHRFGYSLVHPGKPAKPLSMARRIWYNQTDNVKQLFIGHRVGMQNRQNVAIRIPLRSRLKTFIFHLGKDFLPTPVFKRIFRKVWIKKVHM